MMMLLLLFLQQLTVLQTVADPRDLGKGSDVFSSSFFVLKIQALKSASGSVPSVRRLLAAAATLNSQGRPLIKT